MGYKLGKTNLLTAIVLLFTLIFTSELAFSEALELSPTLDTFVNSRNSTRSYNSNKYIRVRDSRRSQRLGLMEFDLSDIAQGSTIEKAELWLYVAYKRGSGILTVSEIVGDWDESVNWKNKPDASGLAEDSANVNRRGIYYKFDLTNLAQDWIDGVVENNGIQLGLEDSAYIIINSDNNSTKSPKLKITYKEPVRRPEFRPEPLPEQETTPTPQDDPGGPGVVIANTGVSDAPLIPVDRRVVIVAQDGTGDYRRISDAVDRSRPGDTIQVKDGIYEERVNIHVSGTKDLPITLINYPDHSPVIDPGGGQYPTECCPPEGTPRVEINAEWIILQGFEIRYGWEGIKIYKDHNTIRENWIHHNSFAGVLVVSASDVFIGNNTINNNGTDEDSCISPFSGERNPKNCHGIYFSNYFCDGMNNNTIRANAIRNHGGRGVQWNSECDSRGVIRNTLVENNMLENNSWGMVMFFNTEDSTIINNTVVIEDYPSTNDSNHTFVGIYGSRNNIFMNNIFHSSRDDVFPLFILDEESKQNSFDYNLWSENKGEWYWGGDWRGDFNNHSKVSGWDRNAVMGSGPGFMDPSRGNYHISSSSKARNNGSNSYCAQADIDNEARNANSEDKCDIGADERF